MQKSLKIGIAPALDKIGNLLGNFLELDRNWNWNFMKLAPLVKIFTAKIHIAAYAILHHASQWLNKTVAPTSLLVTKLQQFYIQREVISWLKVDENAADKQSKCLHDATIYIT